MFFSGTGTLWLSWIKAVKMTVVDDCCC